MCDLYKRIYDLCQSKGISIGKMCAELGISRGNLTELKMGRIKTLKADNLTKISNYFGVTIDYLLTGLPANVYECPPDNPWEEELLDAFDQLDVDRQIEAVEHVQNMIAFSGHPAEENKKAPTTNGERSVSDDDIKFALFGGSGEITDAMYREVKEFAALVKLREDMKKNKE